MSKGKEAMKAIQDAIAKLEAERARIDGRIEGLRDAMRLQAGSSAPAEAEVRSRVRRGSLHTTVLEIISNAGEAGVTADDCVREAGRMGITLIRSSVSSLLSRLKNDNVLFFDGERYRLVKFKGVRSIA